MDNLQWNKLRTKYFKECVWHDSTDGNKIRIDYAPHDLFEWFKKNIKECDGNQANSKPANCAIFDVSKMLPSIDVEELKGLKYSLEKTGYTTYNNTRGSLRFINDLLDKLIEYHSNAR